MAQIDIYINRAFAECKELHAAALIDYDYATEYLEKYPAKRMAALARIERIRERLQAINRIGGDLQRIADAAESTFNEGYSAGRKNQKNQPFKTENREAQRSYSIAQAGKKWNF